MAVDAEDRLTLSDGHAYVYRLRTSKYDSKLPAGCARNFVVCKQVEQSAQPPPHDVRQEVKLLSRLRHPNVVCLLEHVQTSSLHKLYMPYYALTLSALLDNASFTPSACSGFNVLSRHLIRQMLRAVAYLHEERVAHRDICPSNFSLGPTGQLVLIDLGIATEDVPTPEVLDADPYSTQDHCDFGTGPYKAPELLFSHTAHEKSPLDLWSLAATIAQFYTAVTQSTPVAVDEESDDDASVRPIWARHFKRPAPKPTFQRQTFFDYKQGDIGLAGSIFRTLGTPTEQSWPEASKMPVFRSMPFNDFPAMPLAARLPNLPADAQRDQVLQLLESLLRISARQRVSASDALQLPVVQGAEMDEPDAVTAMLQPFVRV